MICKNCEAHGEWGCRAGFAPILIGGKLGCHDSERVFDAFHFNQAKDMTVASVSTIGDSIRAMSDEQLADWLCHGCCPSDRGGTDVPDEDCNDNNCRECWLEWLKKEADT